MAANALTFNQVSAILTAITSQATGKTAIAPVNTNEFITVANTALNTGYDPVMQAISQVLSKTIFSTRPYTRKFKGLEADAVRYGNHVRKLNVVDGDFEEDDRVKLTDGTSVDMYSVRKPEVLQTNFYGANVWQKHLTIFKDQLDCAFNGVDEFQRFVTMTLTNVSDMIEQAHETTARAAIANLIGGKLAKDKSNVVHCLTEYKALIGDEALTGTDLMKPENFEPFVKWFFARVQTVSDLFTERTQDYQMQVTGKEITRHTPKRNQKAYMYQPFMTQVDTRVRSTLFGEKWLKGVDYEPVNFWQAFNNPQQLDIVPSAITTTGAIVKGEAVKQNGILGVLFDEEACGYTTINQWSQATPFNARGGYHNIFWHFTDRYWNDFTEKCVVFLLD